MGTRTNRGKLTVVTGGQSVSEGRPSRAAGTGKLKHRPNLEGEAGAISALVLAVADPLLSCDDEAGRARAMQAVRYARKRVRRVLGHVEALRVFAAVQVTRRDIEAIAKANTAVRPRLVAGAVEAVVTMREHDIKSTSARTSIAIAKRLGALGSALLDVGAVGLHVDVLKAGAAMLHAARLELLAGLELERRAALGRDAAPSFTDEDFRAREREMQARHEVEARASGLIPLDDEPKEQGHDAID